MFAPTRFLYALRPHTSVGVLAAAIATNAVFTATPFALTEVAERYDVAVGTSGLLSTLQVGVFALVNLAAPRFVRPSVALLRGSALVLGLTGVVAGVSGRFDVFLVSRAVAGGAQGLVTWIAWADAAGHPRRTSDVAASGPLAAIVGAPALAWLADRWGVPGIYLPLAALAAVALVVPARIEAGPRSGHGRLASKTNWLLLAALGLLTLGGSAQFVFAGAALLTRVDVDPVLLSLGFSVNAAAGLLAAPLAARGGRAGPWLAVTAAAAVVTLLAPGVAVFALAMALWGLTFWIGVPRVFGLLAARSNVADERVGQAQALMAIGRAVGPSAGGALVGGGRFGLLAALAGATMFASGALVTTVETARSRLP